MSQNPTRRNKRGSKLVEIGFFGLALWEAVTGLVCYVLGVRVLEETPVLTYAPTPLNTYLVAACSRLRRFCACPWASGAAAQMVVATLKPSPMIRPFTREMLILEDGVQVALDWQHAATAGGDGGGDSSNGKSGGDLPADAPLIVCAHGLGGDSGSTYLRVFAEICRTRGWRCVVYNRRGHARISVLPTSDTEQASSGAGGKDSVGGSGDDPSKGFPGGCSEGSNSESGDEDEGGFLERATTPEEVQLEEALAGAAALLGGSEGGGEGGKGSGGFKGGALAEVELQVEVQARAGGSPVAAGASAALRVAKIFPKHCDIEDMEEVVAHIVRRFPSAPKVLVGFSAGSNLVVQFCGTVNTAPRNPFLAAVSISNAHNLMTGTRLLKGRPLSDALMTSFLQDKLAEGLADIRALADRTGVHLNFNRLLRTCHFREFEELLMCPIYGYKTIDDYYREVSCCKDFEHVRLPLLSLANLDDPIIHPTLTEVAVNAARTNPNIISVVTRRGGHLGWQHGWGAEPWMHQLLEQFVEAVLEQRAGQQGQGTQGKGQAQSDVQGMGKGEMHGAEQGVSGGAGLTRRRGG